MIALGSFSTCTISLLIINILSCRGCPWIGIAYTSEQKGSEWKNNRRAVVAGRFLEEDSFFPAFFFLFYHLVLDTRPSMIQSKSEKKERQGDKRAQQHRQAGLFRVSLETWAHPHVH